MRRSVNNVVALIPEWEYHKLNLNAYRLKISNGYIINPKDLSGISELPFSIEVFKMGGMVMTMQEAENLKRSNITTPIFNKPIIQPIEVEESPEDIPTEIEEDELPLEDIDTEDTIIEEIKEEEEEQ